MLSNPKKAKDANINSPVKVGSKTVRNILSKFAPKHAELNRGQFDASNLKAILNNCKIFEGWVSHNAFNGWLPTFQVVAKMRNDTIGHNNAYRLRYSLYFCTIFLLNKYF